MSAQPTRWSVALFAAALSCAAWCESVAPGPAIDVAVVNPEDGSNRFAIAAGQSFEVELRVHPVDLGQFPSQAASCDLAECAGAVVGGRGHLAAGLLQLRFDPAALTLVSSEIPGTGAAADGIVLDAGAAQGRIGWALAGDFVIDGDRDSGLRSICEMATLSAPEVVLRLTFRRETDEDTTIHLATPEDVDPFALSFADRCSTSSFTLANGAIDQVIDGLLVEGPIFKDGFEGP